MFSILLLFSLTTYQIQGNNAQTIYKTQPTIYSEQLQGNEGESNIFINYEATETLQSTIYGGLLQ